MQYCFLTDAHGEPLRETDLPRERLVRDNFADVVAERVGEVGGGSGGAEEKGREEKKNEIPPHSLLGMDVLVWWKR